MNDKDFRGTIKRYMEMRNIHSFLALIEGSPVGSYPTFRKKWRNPDLFTIRDVDYFIKRLNVRECDRPILKGETN